MNQNPQNELGPMHDSSPDGCPDDCEACAREVRFDTAAKRALSLLGAGRPKEAAPLLWEAHTNAPTPEAQAKIAGVLRDMREGNPHMAETRLAEVIEFACFD